MTFSHEVGHNFGAIHDDDTSPSRHDCRQNTYIMSSTGSSEKDLQFSHCSLQNMSKTLDHVSRKKNLTISWQSDMLKDHFHYKITIT